MTLAGKSKAIEELEREMEEPGFWDDPEISKQDERIEELKGYVWKTIDLEEKYEDMQILLEMGYEERSRLASGDRRGSWMIYQRT